MSQQNKGKGKQIFSEDDELNEDLMFEGVAGTHPEALEDVVEAAKNQPEATNPAYSLTFDDDDNNEQLQKAIKDSLSQSDDNRAGESSAAGTATGSHMVTFYLQESIRQREKFSKEPPSTQLKVCLEFRSEWEALRESSQGISDEVLPRLTTVMTDEAIPDNCDGGLLWTELETLRDASCPSETYSKFT